MAQLSGVGPDHLLLLSGPHVVVRLVATRPRSAGEVCERVSAIVLIAAKGHSCTSDTTFAVVIFFTHIAQIKDYLFKTSNTASCDITNRFRDIKGRFCGLIHTLLDRQDYRYS